jgi:hypothetical protein
MDTNKPLTASALADAFDTVWNAALGYSRDHQEGHAFAAILAESFSAVAANLRTQDGPAEAVPAPAVAIPDVADLLEDLDRGVPWVGVCEDNSTDLYDVDDANSTMADAARIIRSVVVPQTPYMRSGVMDKDGREICVGDMIVIDLSSPGTKKEYWRPIYSVVFKAPHFDLVHIGGDKDSDTARFYWRVPQPTSTAAISILDEKDFITS